MASRLAFAVVVAMAFSTLDAAAQWRGRGYSGITVYEDPDFRGDSVTFRDEIRDLRSYGLNDRVTSLQVDGNQAWEACQDINFGGRCRVFSGSVDDLRDEGFNDRISSLRPVGFARGNTPGPWGNRGGNRASQSRLSSMAQVTSVRSAIAPGASSSSATAPGSSATAHPVTRVV
jgi:hypothetical protein